MYDELVELMYRHSRWLVSWSRPREAICSANPRTPEPPNFPNSAPRSSKFEVEPNPNTNQEEW